MNDDEIADRLRSAKDTLTAVDLAELAGDLAGTGLTQGIIAMMFKRAFPEIPLRVLLDAGAWNRVSNGGMTDEEFNALFRPWLGGFEPGPGDARGQ
jgi:hypothetical protein